jgi:hypothetical protein
LIIYFYYLRTLLTYNLCLSFLQVGLTPLHEAARFNRLDVAQYLVLECGADVHAKDSKHHNALYCCRRAKLIAKFLRPLVEPKFKMYALCMGLHRRLGVDSPLNMLNLDVMQEIAKHLPEQRQPSFASASLGELALEDLFDVID